VGDVNIGPTEGLIVLVIVMLLFGASRLPSLARSLGQASTEFRTGLNDRRAPEALPPTIAPPDDDG
jgi:sec-independent protein translocase protein TatA